MRKRAVRGEKSKDEACESAAGVSKETTKKATVGKVKKPRTTKVGFHLKSDALTN